MKEQVEQTAFSCHSSENKDESTFNYTMTPVAYHPLASKCFLTSSLICCVWSTCCDFELWPLSPPVRSGPIRLDVPIFSEKLPDNTSNLTFDPVKPCQDYIEIRGLIKPISCEWRITVILTDTVSGELVHVAVICETDVCAVLFK